jgi:hypothetical protein
MKTCHRGTETRREKGRLLPDNDHFYLFSMPLCLCDKFSYVQRKGAKTSVKDLKFSLRLCVFASN